MLVSLKAALAFIPDPIKRIIVGCVGVVVFLWGHAAYYKSAGKAEVLADSKKAGIENAQKSETHHSDASRPGAAARVRQKYCRDC
jgi:hypothetical protein